MPVGLAASLSHRRQRAGARLCLFRGGSRPASRWPGCSPASRRGGSHARWKSQHLVAALLLTSAQIRAARSLIRWTAEDLAAASALSVATIRRAELKENQTALTSANDLAIRRALESAGVEFIDENGGGPAIRWRALICNYPLRLGHTVSHHNQAMLSRHRQASRAKFTAAAASANDISRAETGGGRAAPTVVGGLRRLALAPPLASKPEFFGSGRTFIDKTARPSLDTPTSQRRM